MLNVVGNREIAAVIMMAGIVRPSAFTQAIKRHVIDLPISNEQTILGAWLDNLENLISILNQNHLTVRIIQDQHSIPIGKLPPTTHALHINVETDPSPLRGTGGVLHDVTKEYRPNDYVIVINASQVVHGAFQSAVVNLINANADIAIAATTDGTPLDIMLIKCSILSEISSIGYNDFKEQALSSLSQKHNVRMVRNTNVNTLRVRDLDTYINAIREYTIIRLGAECSYDTDYDRVFRIVENDSNVQPSSIIYDSVVLDGAYVNEDAVVVRSLVGPNAIVKKEQSVVEVIVNKENRRDNV